jgi:hypothetical protein
MATVPNCEGAIIAPAKIADYLLSDVHPVGQAKAQFLERFGFHAYAPEELIRALLDHVEDNAIANTETFNYGTKYRVDGPLASPDGRDPLVSTVWIVLDGEATPRFVTAFPC